MKTLVLGGNRSGKSLLAEKLAVESSREVLYIATAAAEDNEIRQRIALHQQRRPSHWQLIEEQIYLSQVIENEASAGKCLLVDCLTIWMANLLWAENFEDLLCQQRQTLLTILHELPGDIIFVSNEVGNGIVPMGKINRRFVDEMGALHQSLVGCCDQVFNCIAGIPQKLK